MNIHEVVPTKAQEHSDTSRAAAVAIEVNAGTLRAAVLDYIRAVGPSGATDEEIQNRLAMRANTERPRRVELVEGGYVADSGRRRAGSSGYMATVWVAAVWVAA
ncbi:MAG: hypothetical protein P1P84_02790 [Deferrisomatales bacterium]|nr:hypothetical protein [Deferrisomatales bacterium]